MNALKIEFLILIMMFTGFVLPLSSAELSSENIILDGELLLPEGYNNGEEEKKECITICEKWGEECIVNINPSATGAGANRKCRRVCQSLAEVCY